MVTLAKYCLKYDSSLGLNRNGNLCKSHSVGRRRPGLDPMRLENQRLYAKLETATPVVQRFPKELRIKLPTLNRRIFSRLCNAFL